MPQNITAANSNKYRLWKILAWLNTIPGYTIPNAALYFTGMLFAMDTTIECMASGCPQNLTLDIPSFFEDPERILAFIISVIGVACLSISNQTNYSEMTLELMSKKNISKSLSFSNNMDILNYLLSEYEISQEDADILKSLMAEKRIRLEYAEFIIYSLSKKKAETETRNFLEKLFLICDLLGTHTKVIVTVGSLLRICNLVMNPLASLIVCATINIVCGQLSQFAVLGRKHDISVFRNGLSSFFESMSVGALVFLIMNIGMGSSSSEEIFNSLLLWSLTLLIQTIHIALNERSFAHLVGYGIKKCANRVTPETQPLLSENRNRVWAGGTKPKTPHHSDGENEDFNSRFNESIDHSYGSSTDFMSKYSSQVQAGSPPTQPNPNEFIL